MNDNIRAKYMSSLTLSNKPLSIRTTKFVLFSMVLFLGIGVICWKKLSPPGSVANLGDKQVLTKAELAKVLSNSTMFYHFPTEMKIPGVPTQAVLQYSFDPELQDEMETLYDRYHPDYGAFVALDATTGQVLSVISYSAKSDMKDNLAFRATFPSASVFKVVTAAAAIEKKDYSADTVVMFNGAYHTLYKHNIIGATQNRWTRHVKLKEAFAKSINAVFAKIGAYAVGPKTLRTYADRFGFNHHIPADFQFQEGRAPIPDDTWGIAQTASGFTRHNTMSPMQGALIAAAIVNGGKMMEPYLVQSVYTQDGTEIYNAKPQVANLAVDPDTAAELRQLMRGTVTRGTSSKSFRGFSRSRFRDIDVGGKTGSLTGMDPKGKYDWFVAFAQGRGHRLAFAAMTINEKVWRVKSSYLVRRAIETYFKDKKKDDSQD